MKKKKLKKKIKFFENRLISLGCRLNKLENKFEKTDSHLGEDWQAAIQIVNDSCNDLKEAKEKYEKAERSVKNTLDEFNKRLMILESRTRVDYTQFNNATGMGDSNGN